MEQSTARHPCQQQQPLIQPQIPAGEEQQVEAVFDQVQQHLGFIPDPLQLYSISPPLMNAFMGSVSYFNMGGTTLPRELTAMIRYLGSTQVGCAFCIDFNEGLLINMGMDPDQLQAARINPDEAPLDEKNKRLLLLALKAITAPDEVNARDLDEARQQGWSDREIFDAVVQAANNRALNYILRTFKVEQQGTFA